MPDRRSDNSTQVELNGKSLEVRITPAGRQALAQRQRPLLVEMELYFSCLIRYKVRFHEKSEADSVAVNEKLSLRFRPVMTASCGNDYEGDEPPLTDFPIARPAAFTPHWLNIDYRRGQWQGEFGY